MGDSSSADNTAVCEAKAEIGQNGGNTRCVPCDTSAADGGPAITGTVFTVVDEMVIANNANRRATVVMDTHKRGQCALSAPQESTRLKLIAPPMRAAASALIVLQARQPQLRGSIWPQVLMPRRQTPFARMSAVKRDTIAQEELTPFGALLAPSLVMPHIRMLQQRRLK